MLALRKGADAIPRSGVIFIFSIGMLFVSTIFLAALVDGMRAQNYVLTFSAYSLGLAFYGAVLLISGYAGRILQTLSAIVACGALIEMLYVAEQLIFRTLLGSDIANTVGILIIFWSVPVEGHIIARAIQRHPFVGIAIAMAALLLQLEIQSVFAASP